MTNEETSVQKAAITQMVVAMRQFHDAMADLHSAQVSAVQQLLESLEVPEVPEEPVWATTVQMEEIQELMGAKGYSLDFVEAWWEQEHGEPLPGKLTYKQAGHLIAELMDWEDISGPPDDTPVEPLLTKEQDEAIFGLIRDKGIPIEKVREWVQIATGKSGIDLLTVSEADALIRALTLGDLDEEDGGDFGDGDGGSDPPDETPSTDRFQLDDEDSILATVAPSSLGTDVLSGEVDFSSGTWKASLHTTSLQYNRETMSSFSDLGFEIPEVGGYTAGGFPVSLSAQVDTGTDQVQINIDPVTLQGVTANNVKWVVVYRSDPLPNKIAVVYEFADSQRVNGTDLEVTFPDNLLLNLSTDDDGSSNDTFQPPEVGFDESLFEEPELGNTSVSISNRSFNSVNTSEGDVVEVYSHNPTNEEWRGIGNTLRWRIDPAKHNKAHFKARKDTNDGWPDHRPFCVKLGAGANGDGPFEDVHFWDLGFYNEGENDSVNNTTGETVGGAARFCIGTDEFTPNANNITDDQDYSNFPGAPANVGIYCFHRTDHRIPCGPTEVNCNPTLQYGGYGVKMHAHQTAPHDNLWDGCVFSAEAQEHSIYEEYIQRMHVRNCYFAPTGGNAIQVVSRGGHLQAPWDGEPDEWQGFYGQGNPFSIPSGLNGWALIEDSIIDAQFLNFRDASEISFTGFLGPVVIRNITINNCISGINFGNDTFKGAWLGNGTTVPWNQPQRWRQWIEGGNFGGDAINPTPPGLFQNHPVWIDNVTMTREDVPEQRGGMQFSAIQEVHLGRFNISGWEGGGNWHIRFDNDMQASNPLDRNPNCIPMGRTDEGLPAAYFYDRDSVWASRDYIAVWDPNFGNIGDFRKMTLEELDAMTIGGL